ncbi:alpha/beta hydrolase [Edaphobacter paludis]|uniref:Proline iminopeptidase n=1 Tax=Edaphobacter paludis TaxID=3035702 RepID=A0AAU7D3F6_9BACT
MKKNRCFHGCALFVSLLACQCVAQTQTIQSTAAAEQPQQKMMSRQKVTDIIAASRKIVSPNGVEELLPVQINGITQWLSIRGRDRRNPILLFLHGGPGSPTMPADYTFQSPWEDYFTVVQWDQRGAGKTYASNDPKALASTMTVEQMTSDAEQVVLYLQKNYGKKKIFLLGHSWGTVLGVALAQRHPDWFYAYLGVGQVVNDEKSEEEGYQFAMQQAKSHNNLEAEKELTALAPYPGKLTFDRIGEERKWLMYYGGLTYGRTNFSYDGNAWSLSPDYTQKDLDLVNDGSFFSVTYLLGALEAVDYDSVTNFKCPIFLFEGRHDYTTSHTLAAEWFARIHAPSKKFVWFNNSAHMVMQEEPGRFLYHLITDVRPLAAKAGDVPPGDEQSVSLQQQ